MNKQDGLVVFEILEEAFLGVGHQFGAEPMAVYDMTKSIGILSEDMGEEEGREYFFHNVLGLGLSGEIMPVFIELKE